MGVILPELSVLKHMETHFETVCGCKPTDVSIAPGCSVCALGARRALSARAGNYERVPRLRLSPLRPVASSCSPSGALPLPCPSPAVCTGALGSGKALQGEARRRQSLGTPLSLFLRGCAALVHLAALSSGSAGLRSRSSVRSVAEGRDTCMSPHAAVLPSPHSSRLAQTLPLASCHFFLYLFAFSPSLPPLQGRLWAGSAAMRQG